MLGERILTARLASGMTQAALSSATGIAASKISKMETGMSQPLPSDIEAISRATTVPASFFQDIPLYPAASGRYRKQSKTSKSATKTFESQSRMIAELVQSSSKIYPLRSVTLKPLDTQPINDDVIAMCAENARASLGIGEFGPVGNVVRSCERGGIAVAIVPSPAKEKELSGFSLWGNMGDDRPIIVVSSALSGDVLRSTVAHELGHLILHTRNPLVEASEAEAQAWSFANRFLFPENNAREIFSEVPPTLHALMRLKSIYGVSISFLMSCCENYGIVSKERSRSLHKQYSSRKWYGNEPVKVEEEQASMIPAIISRLRGDGRDVCLREFDAWRLQAQRQTSSHRRTSSTIPSVSVLKQSE